MKKRTQVVLTFSFLVLLVLSLYIFTDWFSKVTGYFYGGDEETQLARCLESKNSEFYSAVFCPECEKQKKEFGQAFKIIRTIDCGKMGELCPSIRSVPSWNINKQIYYGFYNISELKEISDCLE